MPPSGEERNLQDLPTGALNGENNGLSLLLDAETFDYGNGFYALGERAGEGFKVAVVHPWDMPIMRQTGVNVRPGKFGNKQFLQIILGSLTQLAVSTSMTSIEPSAVTTFLPMERKCWEQKEINLSYLEYADGYRYEMSNCLYEATMQKAFTECGCYPGCSRSFPNKTFISGNMNPSYVPCRGKSLNCFNNIFDKIGKSHIRSDLSLRKLPRHQRQWCHQDLLGRLQGPAL